MTFDIIGLFLNTFFIHQENNQITSKPNNEYPNKSAMSLQKTGLFFGGGSGTINSSKDMKKPKNVEKIFLVVLELLIQPSRVNFI